MRERLSQHDRGARELPIDVAVAMHGWGTFDWDAPNGNPFRFGSDGIERPLLLGGRNRTLASLYARACGEDEPSGQRRQPIGFRIT